MTVTLKVPGMEIGFLQFKALDASHSNITNGMENLVSANQEWEEGLHVCSARRGSADLGGTHNRSNVTPVMISKPCF